MSKDIARHMEIKQKYHTDQLLVAFRAERKKNQQLRAENQSMTQKLKTAEEKEKKRLVSQVRFKSILEGI